MTASCQRLKTTEFDSYRPSYVAMFPKDSGCKISFRIRVPGGEVQRVGSKKHGKETMTSVRTEAFVD